MFIISMCFHKNQNKTILTCIKRKQTQYSIDSCFSFIISGIVPYAYKNKYLLIKAIKDQIDHKNWQISVKWLSKRQQIFLETQYLQILFMCIQADIFPVFSPFPLQEAEI